MSSAIAIFEKLLDDENTTSKEHIIETASPRFSQDRCVQKFDDYVREISAIWGEPAFNDFIDESKAQPAPAAVSLSTPPSSEENGEEKKAEKVPVIPPWCRGAARNSGTPRTLKLAYWKRDTTTNFVVLRTELDPRNTKPLYFDFVLGARRPKKTEDLNAKAVAGLREVQQKEHWMHKVVNALNWLRGR